MRGRGSTAAQQTVVRFLRAIHGGARGLIEIRAFDPVSRKPVHRSFHKKRSEAVETICQQASLGRNVFVGTARRARRSGKKDSLREASVVWVDLDFRGEGDEKRLRGALRAFDLPPTLIVSTGGGLHAYWLLREPFPLDHEGSQRRFESVLKGLVEELGGDAAATDCSRMMRVAGTVNRLTPAKRKQGRRPSPTSIEELHPHREYTFEDFERFALVEDPDPVEYDLRQVEASLESAPWLTRILAADVEASQLFHGRAELEDQSRVDWQLGLRLVRARLSPPQVHTALKLSRALALDPGEDKKRGRDEYFKRTVSKLFAHAKRTLVEEINKDHALLIQGGAAVVLRELPHPEFDELQLEFLKPHALRDFFGNQRIRISRNRTVGAGEIWLHHPDRRTYNGLAFLPGAACDPRWYNLWRGYAVEPRKGDCSFFWDHVHNNICCGDEALFAWVQAWMAFVVQRLGERPGTALVLQGGQGTGKGVYANTTGKLFGRHFHHITTADGLTRNFNAHLLNKRLVFGDESFWAGDKHGAGVLKALVTEDSLQIEMKHRDVFSVRNHLCLILASNRSWVVPAGMDERRFAVLEVGEGRKQDREYFGALIEQLEHGGYQALLYDLLHFDLENCGVDPRVVPRTEALLSQKLRSLSLLDAWWYEKLREGRLPSGKPWTSSVSSKVLYQDYQGFCEANRRRPELEPPPSFGAALRKLAPGLVRRQIRVRRPSGKFRRPYVYQFPPLEKCRETFERRLGQRIEWQE